MKKLIIKYKNEDLKEMEYSEEVDEFIENFERKKISSDLAIVGGEDRFQYFVFFSICLLFVSLGFVYFIYSYTYYIPKFLCYGPNEITYSCSQKEACEIGKYMVVKERDSFITEFQLYCGEKRETLTNKMSFKPVIEKDLIKGKVIYIDGYQNVITNIDENLFNEVVKGRKFKILLRAGNYEISTISQSYLDVSEGELLALFDSENQLEIAINKGKASSLLGIDIDDVVRIEVLV